MLNTPVETLNGIGERKKVLLNKMMISTYNDILTCYPHRYIDRRKCQSVSTVKDGETACIVAKINDIKYKRGKKEMMILEVSDHFASGEILFFSPKFLKDKFVIGKSYYFFGKVEKRGLLFKMIQPDYDLEGNKQFLTIIPVYPLTSGITNRDMINYHKQVILRSKGYLKENLPQSIVSEAKLVSRETAYEGIHFPKSAEHYKAAKRRLVFEELFIMQLKLILLKNNYHKQSSTPFAVTEGVESWIKSLPFSLTNAQKKAMNDIKSDLTSGYAMNRLIQGDVGSGKTILAFASIYLAVLNNQQALLMAPTSILAEQHFNGFKKLFGESVSACLLTSDVKSRDKVKTKEALSTGEIKVAIGTHALIQEDVVFKDLGLVVADEQHRFGIRQRLTATQKGKQTHTLLMSATPIPRTLSLILYGDMDVSVVDEMPEGRKPIKTHFVQAGKTERMYEFMREKLTAGKQAYVVCPLVEASESLDLTSAVSHFESLKQIFSEFEVGLIHGKMSQKEKDQIMKAFNNNEIQVLVSTTVIEVGINVPNATIMVVMDSERFGLSQLHQLRGRVGRGDDQSYCFLLSEKLGKTSKERIESLVNSSSGFDIAEKDLELRGPGEIFGLRQHGLPELKLANLVSDKKTLIEIQKYVKMIISEYQLQNIEVVKYIRRLAETMENWFTL